jgi:hypothetical protein
MHTLADCIEGWPAGNTMVPTAVAETDTAKVIQQMIAADMLTSDLQAGKLATPTTADSPQSALIDGYVEHRPAIRPKDVWYFLTASLISQLLLRRRNVERAIAHLQSHTRKRDDAQDPDLSFARERVAIFKRLRPLLYTARGACLFDSLALCIFLSRYRLFPRWIFGVTTRPFEAHCWVQHRGTVFNDTPEHVGSFTPILVV